MTWPLIWALLSAATPTTELVQLPIDITSYARGAGAVPVDPAAPGKLAGFELQLRDHGTNDVAGVGAFGVYTAIPAGAAGLYAGYEWSNLPDPQSERLILGGAIALAPQLRFGVSYQALWPTVQLGFGNVLNAGFLVEPNRWFSVSLGLDALNAPTFDDGTALHRALRLGVAVRPWHGDPAISLAADSRMIVTDDPQAVSTRAVLDVSPWEGVHVWGAYQHLPHDDAFWAGLSLAVLGTEVMGTSRADSSAPGGFWDHSGASLTVRSHPQETLIRPAGRMVEIPLVGDLQQHETGLFETTKEIPTVVLELEALARDRTVDKVLLPVRNLKVGMATVDELRAAIHRLRAAGKEVIAELEGGDSKTYMVAAAASRIRLDPITTLNLHGFAVNAHYFATPLSKLGVRFDAVGVGKYKSGPDALTRDTPRPEDAEVEKEILDLAYATLVRVLHEDRKLSDEKVHTILDAGLADAPQALAWGLVDELHPSGDPNKVPPAAQHGINYADTQRPWPLWSNPPVIAVVPVVGAIAQTRGENPLPGVTAESRDIVPQLEAVAGDPSVRAVVVRINSPGGDVFASELIWRAIRRVAAVKPVVISMGDVAASGGYYAAAAGHVILAQPNTITGSIGIFMVKPDIGGVLEKLGIHKETYMAGEHADWESFERGMTDADKERLHKTLENYYGIFVGRVAAGRKLPEERVRDIAEGRVYTGAHAKELGLVDALGGLDDAVRLAAERAHVPMHEALVAVPERIPSLPDLARRMLMTSAQAPGPLQALQEEVLGKVRALEGKALAVMPYGFAVETP